MTSVPEAELRAELLRRRDREQQARVAYLDARDRGEDPDWAPVHAIDEDNLAFLIEMIGRHGWLGSDLVGTDGASACWLMVQHAPLENQDAWLPLMEQALGDGLAKPGELVYLQDRVNMRHGRPQTHGSQSWGSGSGEVRLWPVTDPATLNARRAQVGLPPLGDDIIASAWTPDQLREHGCRLAEDNTVTETREWHSGL
jgi:hypothetical protein